MLPISTKEPLPVSTKDVIRISDILSPSGGKLDAVFVVPVPSVREAAAIQAAALAETGRFPSNAEYIAALRDAVAEYVVDEQQPNLLGIIDEYEAAIEDQKPVPPDVAQHINEIEQAVRQCHRRLAEITAARILWSSTVALVRAAMMLVAIEGPNAPTLTRNYGRLTDETVEAIDRHYGSGTMVALGHRIAALISPTKEQEKNSASPQPSPPGPVTSKAAKRQLTAAPGKSSEPSIPATLN